MRRHQDAFILLKSESESESDPDFDPDSELQPEPEPDFDPYPDPDSEPELVTGPELWNSWLFWPKSFTRLCKPAVLRCLRP